MIKADPKNYPNWKPVERRFSEPPSLYRGALSWVVWAVLVTIVVAILV